MNPCPLKLQRPSWLRAFWPIPAGAVRRGAASVLAGFLVLALAVPSFAATRAARPQAGKAAPAETNGETGGGLRPVRPAKDVETRIVADKMSYLAEQQRAVFENKVHVLRPDFQLWADKLTVHMKPPARDARAKTAEGGAALPEGLATGDVDRLVASGNVRMSSEGGRSGSCSTATYLVDQGVLRMEGNPRVSDGENTITGETILYYTKENRSEVLGGGNKRVEAVFSSPSKPTREGGKR